MQKTHNFQKGFFSHLPLPPLLNNIWPVPGTEDSEIPITIWHIYTIYLKTNGFIMFYQMHVWGCRLGSHGLVASSMEGHGCQALPYDGEVELGHTGYAQHPWYKTGSPSPQSWMTQKAGLYLWSHDGLQPLASIPCGCCQHRKACEVPLPYSWHEAWPLWEKGPAKLVKVSSQKLQVHKHHQSGIPQVEYDIQKRITRAFEYPCMHACHSKFADAHFTKSIISSSGWWGGLHIRKNPYHGQNHAQVKAEFQTFNHWLDAGKTRAMGRDASVMLEGSGFIRAVWCHPYMATIS